MLQSIASAIGSRFRLATPAQLRAAGVLGMNARNHDYVQPANPPHLVSAVDDKLATKVLCKQYDIATPTLAGVIRHQHELSSLEHVLGGLDDFVVKPSRGSGGKGILVVTDAKDGVYRKASGSIVSLSAIRNHVGDTLSGLFSLGGESDVALIERCIKFSDAFDQYSFQGVPDLRIVVYRGYPVMAMMRCSTKVSDGKANLHQGAVGVGIDLATGRAVAAVQFDKSVDRHPDTGAYFHQLEVPQWQRHLELATTAFEMTGLGYIGADIVLDQQRGPMVLELNARPGLAIQTANLRGLYPRLERIASMSTEVLTPAERIKFVRQEFADTPLGEQTSGTNTPARS